MIFDVILRSVLHSRGACSLPASPARAARQQRSDRLDRISYAMIPTRVEKLKFIAEEMQLAFYLAALPREQSLTK